MNYDAARLWFDIAQLILTGLIGLYVYFTNRHRVTNMRIGELERDVDSRLDEHASKISRMEVAIENAPTHDDLGDLHKKVNEVNGNVENIKGIVTGIARTQELISQHLLSTGGKP